MLCALGAAVFAAVPGRVSAPWRALATLAGGFAITAAWLVPARLPDHASIGLITAVVAGVSLTRPGHVVLPLAAAGMLAASWGTLLAAQGLPAYAALPLALLVPLVSMRFSAHRDSFVTPLLRDEALTGALVGGLVVAMLPGILDGWRAAASLSVPGEAPAPAAMIPAWTLAVGAAALGGGAMYSFWSRR